MDFTKAAYLAPDRLQALIAERDLPQIAEGSILFADISGFTPLTERLREAMGERHGAEALAEALNRVYDALIAEVDRYGGSIIGFAGDAITCWFSGEASAVQAAACGFALLAAMHSVERIDLPGNAPVILGLKVVITTGITRRFLVGDPDIQQIDALAGAAVARIAVGETLAERGELLADAVTVERLGSAVRLREWRQDSGERFAVLEGLNFPVQPLPLLWAEDVQVEEALLSPMLPAFARHQPAGLDAFQIELRPVTTLFLRFTGIDYDNDSDAGKKLDGLIQQVQRIVTGYEGNVIQLTIGDKGSYLCAAFGAPYAHEDDPARALNAALDIRDQTVQLATLDSVQIGISRGVMRTGAYGGKTRRTYGVLGDEINLAARLMQQAGDGTILISESMLDGKLMQFALQSLAPIQVKGKALPIRVFEVIGRRDRSFEERFYTTPMVGRDAQLTQMLQALHPISAKRHAGVIIVHGDAGMGKSRLVFEVQQRLRNDASVTWLIGQADALNRAPLSAFAYFLRPYFGQQRERETAANQAAFDDRFEGLVALADDAIAVDLTLYRSFLAGILGLIIPGSPYELADEKLRVDNAVVAIKTWVRAESRRQPLVIQLEDAQWLDATSIRAVQQLTYNMDGVPLALVLTSRYNDDGSSLSIANIFSVQVHSFDLNRLSEVALREVARAVLNGAISEEMARFIAQRAEGNPFFTEQLVLDLKERDALVETNGVWNLRPNAAAEVPSGVNAVLIARLDRLTAQVKAVVQTASVLGREFEIAVLSQMLREGDFPAVQEAEREAIWTALDELRYLFRHALLRDAAYNMQAQERLKALHRLAAETIEQLYAEDQTQADALLEHWHAAAELDHELPYLDTVLKRLVQIDARYAEAEQLINRALPQLDDGDSRRISLLIHLSGVYQRRGLYNSTFAPVEQAQHLAEEANDWMGLAASHASLAETLWRQNRNPEARSHLEISLDLYRKVDYQQGIASTLRSLGNLALSESRYEDARAYLQDSLAICREIGDRRGAAGCLQTLGMTAEEQGHFEEGREFLLQSIALVRELGFREAIAGNLSNLGVLTMDAGLFDEAKTYFEQSMALQREIGNRRSFAIVLSNLGSVATEQGRFQEAHDFFDQAIALYREMGIQNYLTLALVMHGSISILQRRYDEARAYFEQTLPVQQQIGDRYGTGVSLAYLSVIAFHEGNYTAAELLQQQSLAIRRETQDHFLRSSLAWLARIYLRLDRSDAASIALRESLSIVSELLARHKLEVLVSAVEWYFATERDEAGIELLGLILGHERVDMETRIGASDLLDARRVRMDSAALNAALERGKSLDLDITIERLLAELG